MSTAEQPTDEHKLTTVELHKKLCRTEIKLSKTELKLERLRAKQIALMREIDSRTPHLELAASLAEADAKMEVASKERLRRSLVEVEFSRYFNDEALQRVLNDNAKRPFTFSIPCDDCGELIRHIKLVKDRRHCKCMLCGGCELEDHRCA